MRYHYCLPLLLAAACGSSDPIDTTLPNITRAERQSLLPRDQHLAGQALRLRKDGSWETRTLSASAGSGGGAPEAGSSARPVRASGPPPAGPATGGPAGPTTPSPSALSISAGDAYSPRAVAGEARAPAATSALPAAPSAAPTAPVAATPVAALRAGSSDDNATFAAFVDFLTAARQDSSLNGQYRDLDVADRCYLRVVDPSGRPCPGQELRVVDDGADKVIWRGTTYGDGRVPFYPAVARADGAGAGPYLVEVPFGERMLRQKFSGKEDLTLRLPAAPSAAPMQLDVAFVIDTTGSMADEIAAIQATLLQVTQRLRDLGREFDLRYGAVLYRDVGDSYVTSMQAFTGDIEAFDRVLRQIEAGGGGDEPESVNQALAVAVDGLVWRPGAAKVAFLIADAPPHLDYQNDVAYDLSLRGAVARGIKLHAVAASGLNRVGSLVFRQIAQFTRGEFVFLEYGGNLARSAAQHGVVEQNATGNNLDEILFTRIRDEIAHWGRDEQPVAAR